MNVSRQCLICTVSSCTVFLPNSLMAADEWAAPNGRFKLTLKPGETKDLGTITVSPKALQ